VSQTIELTLKPSQAIASRATPGIRRTIAIMLAGTSLFLLMLAAGAIGASSGGASTGAEAASAPFVTAYGNMIKEVQGGLTPENVGLTSTCR
jgi:hypothetical protein